MKKFLKGALFVITAFSLLAISCCDNGGSSSSNSTNFSAQTENILASDLGITPNVAVSANEKIVKASVSSGNVVLTSVGAGSTTVTVSGISNADVSDMLLDTAFTVVKMLNVTVADSGVITTSVAESSNPSALSINLSGKKYKSTDLTLNGRVSLSGNTYETLEFLNNTEFKLYEIPYSRCYDGKGSYTVSGTSLDITFDGSWGHFVSGTIQGTVSSDGKTITLNGSCTNSRSTTIVIIGTFTLME
ncbi:MAG: hypothetical protein IJP61_04515 [Treponema sp.]|nr:hypothetical protein [Treponema sp.]